MVSSKFTNGVKVWLLEHNLTLVVPVLSILVPQLSQHRDR